MSLPTAAYGIGSAVPPVRRNRPSQVAGTRCPTVEMVLGSPRQARLSNPDSLPDVASPAKSRPGLAGDPTRRSRGASEYGSQRRKWGLELSSPARLRRSRELSLISGRAARLNHPTSVFSSSATWATPDR